MFGLTCTERRSCIVSASRCDIGGVGGGSTAAGSGVDWVPMAGSAGIGAAGRAGR